MTKTELTSYGSALPNLSVPICANGDKSTIITGSDNSSDTQISQKFGLPYLMSQPISGSGIPVPRGDLNCAFNLLSKLVHFLMAGGCVPWSTSEKEAISGYPEDAIVSYNGGRYVSLADDNTAVPTDATKWRNVDPVLTVNGTSPDSDGNVNVSGAVLQNNMSQTVYKDDNFPDGATSITLAGETITVAKDGILVVQVHGRAGAGSSDCEIAVYLGDSASGILLAYVDPDGSSSDVFTYPVKSGTTIFVKRLSNNQTVPSVRISVIYKD